MSGVMVIGWLLPLENIPETQKGDHAGRLFRSAHIEGVEGVRQLSRLVAYAEPQYQCYMSTIPLNPETDALEELRDCLMAEERIRNFQPGDAITLEDLMAKYDLKDLFRHCERSEATQSDAGTGLLRCARNDDFAKVSS